MSTESGTHGGSPIGGFSEEVLENVREVESFLTGRVMEDDIIYMKAGRIGNHLDMSAQQVGLYLSEIRDRDNGLAVERWGCVSTSSQWRIEFAE